MLDNTNAQLQRIYALIKEGKKAEALSALKPILSRQPNLAEAWWLAAHAAPSEKDASFAYEKVVALKPDYAPALQMLNKQRLNDAAVHLYNKQRPEALALINTVLDKQQDNVEAWWLMANAAPSTVEAVLACQKVLALQPDHQEARARLVELQQQSAKILAVKHVLKDLQPPVRKNRPWLIFGLIGLIFMTITGGTIFISITGQTFGLPIGQFFNGSYDLGTLGEKAITKTGALPIGATHEYHFHVQRPTQIMVLIQFSSRGTDKPAKYIKLVGPSNKTVPLPDMPLTSAVTPVLVTVPTAGNYDFVLKGTDNGGQGAYVLQMAAMEDMPDLSPMQP